MNKIKHMATIAAVLLATILSQSCNHHKTYADMKKDERRAIERFIDKQNIEKISLRDFEEDTVTSLAKNQYVFVDGIYMQIVDRGRGETRLTTDQRQSYCVRYIEEKIKEDGTTDTLTFNITQGYHPDCITVTKTKEGGFQGTFDSGSMMGYYQSSAVPTGWLIPLKYIRPGRAALKAAAKVRIIVPHSEGQTHASQNVYPCYYEITYQQGK